MKAKRRAQVSTPFGFGYAAILRPVFSAVTLVAGRALPLAQLLKPLICSLIGLLSRATWLICIMMLKSVGSSFRLNPSYKASMNGCSISEPVEPSVACVKGRQAVESVVRNNPSRRCVWRRFRRWPCPAFGPTAKLGNLLFHEFAQRNQILHLTYHGQIRWFCVVTERLIEAVDE